MLKTILLILSVAQLCICQQHVHLVAYIKTSSPECGTPSILVNSRVPSQVQITNPYEQQDDTYDVNPGQSLNLTLSDSICTSGDNGVENKGVRVLAHGAVTVHGIHRHNSRAGGFIALPVDDDSLNFVIATYNTRSSDFSIFTVVAGEEDTELSIQLCHDSVCNSDVQTVTLKFLDTYTYEAQGQDLTGTFIQSNKPVAVIAGMSQAQITATGLDHIVEQFPPMDAWGTSYVPLTIMYRNEVDIIRIVAGPDETEVTVTYSNGTLYDSLLPFEMLELNGEGEVEDPTYIECSIPCLAVQYNRGKTVDNTGPSMSILWPTESWTDSCDAALVPFGVLPTKYFIRIITDTEKTSIIKLDGAQINGWETLNMKNYSTAYVELLAGYHQVTSQSFVNFASYLIANDAFSSYIFACNADLQQKEDGFRRPPIISSNQTSDQREILLQCRVEYEDAAGVTVDIQWIQDGQTFHSGDLAGEMVHTINETILTPVFGNEVTCMGRLLGGDGTELDRSISQSFHLGIAVLNPIIRLEMPDEIRAFSVKMSLTVPFLCSQEDINAGACYFRIELWNPEDEEARDCYLTVDMSNKDSILELSATAVRSSDAEGEASMYIGLQTSPFVLPHPIWGDTTLTEVQVTTIGLRKSQSKSNMEEKKYCTCSPEDQIICDFNA